MANSLSTNPVIVDTFTSAIDFSDYPYSSQRVIDSIEWAKPTSTSHTFQILSGGSGGLPIFDEQCTTANDSKIKYFKTRTLNELYLAVASGNEKASGYLIIILQ